MLATLVTGVLGALVGGWIASGIFGVDVNEGFWDPMTWLFAIVGGVIVSFLWSLLTGRRVEA